MNEDLLAPEMLATSDDAELLQLLTERIVHLLAHQPDHLMSMLYRLDVQENAVRHALQQEENPAEVLAKLVLHRQRQRIATKAKYRQKPLEDF